MLLFYNQIELKTLQNIAFLFSFGGFYKAFNLGFYIVDLSPTGTGKSKSKKHLFNLLLRPVFTKTDEMMRAFKEKENNKDKRIPIIKAIHGNLISREALYEAFEYCSTQIIETAELGKELKKDNPIFNDIIDLYGNRNIITPTFKNSDKKTSFIDNIDFFFYGDTTLEYLEIKQFFTHLKGGLLNRALLVYNNTLRPFETKPRTHTLQKNIIDYYNNIANEIMEFSKIEVSQPLKEELLIDNPFFYNFSKDNYYKLIKLTEEKNDFKDLYVRVEQNTITIIKTLHLVECFKKGYYEATISNTAIEKGVEYIKYILSGYDELIAAINNKTTSRIEEKVINKARALLLNAEKISLREIYRPLSLKKEFVKSVLAKYKEFKIIDNHQQTIITLNN
jgi:hypothetical protein